MAGTPLPSSRRDRDPRRSTCTGPRRSWRRRVLGERHGAGVEAPERIVHLAVEIGRGSIDDTVDFHTWLSTILEECEVLDLLKAGAHLSRRTSFDKVMGYLGTISGDEVLISHFSQASEIRMRWQIRRYMGDLSHLEGRPVDWSYVVAMWTQAALLPEIDEAPAATLADVLAMLDTHIRRLCHRAGIRPKCLPSRCDPQSLRCKDRDCPHGYPVPAAM
jgi:hypothetical protein